MKILHQGAESKIYSDEIDGQKVLVKDRIKKNYRLNQIDDKIRKERTREEIKLLTEARKNGVPTPKIISADEKDNKIIMEFIDGERIKEYLQKVNEKEVEKVSLEIGKLIGKLHSSGIIHGDLTTSNMILKGDQIYFIDFGLGSFSTRIENQGVDLNLLKQALKSTHFKILKTSWFNILKGYRQEYKKAEEVIRRIEKIEKRARYMER